jgi:hypothetical protein
MWVPQIPMTKSQIGRSSKFLNPLIHNALTTFYGSLRTFVASDPTIPNPHPGGFPPAPDRSEKFGFSVAGVGMNILVGSPEDSLLHEIRGAGAAYLFNGRTGRLLLEIPNPNPNFDPSFNFENFGWSVAGLGEDLIISAPGHKWTYGTEAAIRRHKLFRAWYVLPFFLLTLAVLR